MPTLQNPKKYFGCMPLPTFEFCIHARTKEEIFGLPAHDALAKEVFKSEVDVVIEGIGVIGKVSEVKISLGSRWFKIDTSNCSDENFSKLKQIVINKFNDANRPWLVSEHLNMMNPKIEIHVDDLQTEYGMDHVVAYMLIKGIK